MRIAVIADIHSNLHALRSVLDRIERSDAETVICAGDIVGYGAHPNECCELVKEHAKHTVFGNHELAALTGDTIWMNPLAAVAATWTGNKLTKTSREYLSQLVLGARFEVAGKRVAMYHGAVADAIQYVYEDDLSEHMLKEAQADILVLGHTHIPYVVRFRTGLAVNPGSVGQPRDMDPRASYAILDTEEMSCEVHRVGYDVEGAVDAIKSEGLPPFLAERLLMGR